MSDRIRGHTRSKSTIRGIQNAMKRLGESGHMGDRVDLRLWREDLDRIQIALRNRAERLMRRSGEWETEALSEAMRDEFSELEELAQRVEMVIDIMLRDDLPDAGLILEKGTRKIRVPPKE